MTDSKTLQNKNHKKNILNNGFEEYKLSELGNVYSGLKGKSKENFGKGKKFISYMNIYSNPRINLDINDFVDIDKAESQNKVEYGDIFFTTSSETPDEVAISSVLLDKNIGEVYLNSFCIGYRLYSFEILSPEFARYYFRSKSFRKQINRIAQGAIRYNLSKKYFLEERIRIPSLEEQKAIVSIIEKWDKHIELLDQKIQIKKNIKKYLTQKLLNGKKRLPGFKGDWRLSRLGEIGFFKTSSIDKKIKEGESIVNLVNYMDVYRHKEITNANRKNLMRVSAKDDQIRNNNLIKGDILFTPSSETPDDIGHSIVISEDLRNTLYSYHLVRFRPSITLDIKFSHYFCNQNEVLRQFTKYASGVTRFTLSLDSFSRVEVKIPPFEEQKAISSILSKSDEEITMLEKQRDIIEEQRKYLLNNLVTGEIRLAKFRDNK